MRCAHMDARPLIVSGSSPEKDMTSEMSPLGVWISPRAVWDLFPGCSFCTDISREI
jgi:hypothetical protein